MKLLAETELSSNWAKAIGYEVVYLGDRPLAQIEVSGSMSTTSWLGTDHLGTPFLRTTATRAIDWRAEAEPYGRIWTLRGTTAKHMPLRFPGQEAEQLTTETNGVSEKSYNIHRWYHPSWGRSSQADPIGLRGGYNQFAYAALNPVGKSDNLGLAVWVCNRKTDWGIGNHAYFWDDREPLPPYLPSRWCGMTGKSGNGRPGSRPERGLGLDACERIDRSEGLEDALMVCCFLTGNSGPYFPGTPMDCHGHLKGCTEALGMTYPGAPGGRFGAPRCAQDSPTCVAGRP